MSSNVKNTLFGYIEQLQKAIECSICLEGLHDPVETKCGHTFCGNCLYTALNKKNSILCPLCKGVIKRRSLKKSVYLSKVITALQSVTKAHIPELQSNNRYVVTNHDVTEDALPRCSGTTSTTDVDDSMHSASIMSGMRCDKDSAETPDLLDVVDKLCATDKTSGINAKSLKNMSESKPTVVESLPQLSHNLLDTAADPFVFPNSQSELKTAKKKTKKKKPYCTSNNNFEQSLSAKINLKQNKRNTKKRTSFRSDSNNMKNNIAESSNYNIETDNAIAKMIKETEKHKLTVESASKVNNKRFKKNGNSLKQQDETISPRGKAKKTHGVMDETTKCDSFLQNSSHSLTNNKVIECCENNIEVNKPIVSSNNSPCDIPRNKHATNKFTNNKDDSEETSNKELESDTPSTMSSSNQNTTDKVSNWLENVDPMLESSDHEESKDFELENDEDSDFEDLMSASQMVSSPSMCNTKTRKKFISDADLSRLKRHADSKEAEIFGEKSKQQYSSKMKKHKFWWKTNQDSQDFSKDIQVENSEYRKLKKTARLKQKSKKQEKNIFDQVGLSQGVSPFTTPTKESTTEKSDCNIASENDAMTKRVNCDFEEPEAVQVAVSLQNKLENELSSKTDTARSQAALTQSTDITKNSKLTRNMKSSDVMTCAEDEAIKSDLKEAVGSTHSSLNADLTNINSNQVSLKENPSEMVTNDNQAAGGASIQAQPIFAVNNTKAMRNKTLESSSDSDNAPSKESQETPTPPNDLPRTTTTTAIVYNQTVTNSTSIRSNVTPLHSDFSSVSTAMLKKVAFDHPQGAVRIEDMPIICVNETQEDTEKSHSYFVDTPYASEASTTLEKETKNEESCKDNSTETSKRNILQGKSIELGLLEFSEPSPSLQHHFVQDTNARKLNENDFSEEKNSENSRPCLGDRTVGCTLSSNETAEETLCDKSLLSCNASKKARYSAEISPHSLAKRTSLANIDKSALARPPTAVQNIGEKLSQTSTQNQAEATNSQFQVHHVPCNSPETSKMNPVIEPKSSLSRQDSCSPECSDRSSVVSLQRNIIENTEEIAELVLKPNKFKKVVSPHRNACERIGSAATERHRALGISLMGIREENDVSKLSQHQTDSVLLHHKSTLIQSKPAGEFKEKETQSSVSSENSDIICNSNSRNEAKLEIAFCRSQFEDSDASSLNQHSSKRQKQGNSSDEQIEITKPNARLKFNSKLRISSTWPKATTDNKKENFLTSCGILNNSFNKMDESIDAKCANLESVNENADTHDAVSLRNDETERDCDVIPSSPLLFAASQGEGKKPDKIPLSLSEGGNNEELVDKMLGNIEELKRICEHLDKRYYHVTSKVLELETLVKEITSGQAIGMSSASPVKFKSRKAKRPLPSQNESEAESTQLSLDQSVKNTNQSDQSDVENTNQSDQSDVEINSSLPPLKSFINKNIIPSLKLPLAGSSKGPEIERLAEMKDIVDDSLKNQSEKSTQLTVGGLQCDIIDLAQDVTQQGEESRFQDSPCSTESDVIAVTSRSAMCRKRVISSSDEEEQPRKFLKSSDLIARESTTKASRKDNCRSSAKRSSLSETSDNDQSVIMESCEQSTANIEVAKQSGEENILFEEGESFLSPASNTKEEDVLNNLTDEAPNRESSPVHETSNLSCGKIIIDDSDEEDGNNTPPITDSQVPPPTPPPVDTSYPPHPNKKVVNDLLQSISELTNDNADHDNQAPVEDEDTSSTTRSQPVVLPESENLENEQPKEEYVSSLKQDEDASQSQISKSSHQEMDDTDLDTTTNSSHIEVIHQLHDKTNEAVDSSRCLSGLSISNQSTGNPARKLGIMTSGLRGKAIAFVKLFTKKWGGKFYDTFVAGEVTHVVVRTQQMRCDRTLKYLQAVASKSWVVSISWVTHSLKQKTLLPEDRYEVIGDNLDTSDDMSFGPRRSRLSSPHFKLLSKHVVYCIPPFALFTEAQFIELIHLCGGRVVSRVDDLTKTQSSETRVITVDSDAHTGSLPDYAGLAAKYAAEAVSCTWILDCVATFSIQPTANFPVEDLDSEML